MVSQILHKIIFGCGTLSSSIIPKFLRLTKYPSNISDPNPNKSIKAIGNVNSKSISLKGLIVHIEWVGNFVLAS